MLIYIDVVMIMTSCDPPVIVPDLLRRDSLLVGDTIRYTMLYHVVSYNIDMV